MLENTIKNMVEKAINSVYDIDAQNVVVEHPNKVEHGDFATGVALALTRQIKHNPMEIAKKLAYELRNNNPTFGVNKKKYDTFEKIEIATPGFINFVLSREWLYSMLLEVQKEGKNYGAQSFSGDKKISIEHSTVNPNKAAHIGHLRNACVGQSLERLYKNLGYDVKVQYYSNDVGMQVASSVLGVQVVTDLDPNDYKKYDHYAWDVYTRIESMIASDSELEKKREVLMVKLEDQDSVEAKMQAELSDKILIEQLKTFQNLGIDYDIVIHERDILYRKLWESTFESLKNNKNVYFAKSGKSKGCWLVRLSEESKVNKDVDANKDDDKDVDANKDDDKDVDANGVEEDKIIVRSNGVPTYTGKDIAFHMWKFGLLDVDFDYKKLDEGTQDKDLWTTTNDNKHNRKGKSMTFTDADKVFDVVGGEQSYAIAVVKKALKYLGFKKQADNMYHINYGLVFLSPKTAGNLGIDVSDKKSQYGMSGRKGWGIKIDDFIEMVDEKLVKDHGKFGTLKDVRNGAIKFEMLKYNTFHDLVFDLDSALDINGFSGPYIQYAYARANSVMQKSKTKDESINAEVEKSIEDLDAKELSLLRQIYQYSEVAVRSAEEFSPNLLCTYLFELAQRFNSFYNALPILSAKTDSQKNFRLLITKATMQVIDNGLYLLGVNSPDSM